MKSTMTAAAILLASAALAATPAHAQGYGAPPTTNIPEQPQQQSEPAQAQQSGALKVHTPKVSGGARKAIGALEKAVNANDAAGITAALAAAQASAKTEEDRYAIAMLQLKAAAAAKDNARIAAAIEGMLASGAANAEEQYPLALNLGQTYANMKQNDRAIQAYQKALQASPNSIDATAGLAESMAAAGQAAQALDLLRKGIALQSASGKAPEAWYFRAVQVAYKAKLPQSVELSREWAEAYPSAKSWTNALAIYQNATQLDESSTLDLLRLKRVTGALAPSDYFNYGDIAVRKGFSGEAKSVLEEGFAANAVKRSDPSFSQLYGLATTKTKGDRESLPAAPSATATGKQILTIGDAYYGYGDYSKAAEFYRAALAKGDDPNQGNLHLGMALARQGDKAGAMAAFKAVGGTDTELAKFWLSYLASKA